MPASLLILVTISYFLCSFFAVFNLAVAGLGHWGADTSILG